jgi:glycosyltransferase involved in cell wall biosynthesis
MQILLITNGIGFHGVTTYISMLANSFYKTGNEVHIISMGSATISYFFSGNTYIFGLTAQDLNNLDPRYISKKLEKFIYKIEKSNGIKFDLILLNMNLARRYGKFLNKWNTYAVIHDPNVASHYNSFRLIAVSRYVKNLFEENGYKDIIYIPLPFDPDAVRMRINGQCKYDNFVLFPHRCINEKGINEAQQLDNNIDDIIIMFCNNIKIKSNKIIKLKRMPYPYSYFNKAKCTISLAKKEIAGYCVLESLACGTPVYGYDSAGVAETMREYHSDWLVDPGDFRGIINLINNNRHFEINEKVFDKFNPCRIANKYLALI